MEYFFRLQGSNDEQKQNSAQHDQELIRGAEINLVACTISKFHTEFNMLKGVGLKKVAVEEGAQISRPSIDQVYALPDLEQVCATGDQMQLRNILREAWLSAPKWKQDVSRFEMMQDSNAYLTTALTTNHRMHPDLLKILLALNNGRIYPNLVSSPNANTFLTIPGMKHRTFWFSHREPEVEGGHTGTQSHIMPRVALKVKDTEKAFTNSHEIMEALALCKDLVRLGAVKVQEIAIIAPYQAQLALAHNIFHTDACFPPWVDPADRAELLRENLLVEEAPGLSVDASNAEGLRMGTTASFQGKETRTSILLLTRSNPKQSIGFRKDPRRRS